MLPAWSRPGFTWSPAVLQRGGVFVMYVAVREPRYDRQAIAVAVADGPAGPFRPMESGPLVFQRRRGGTIDPDPFVDEDGSVHLLYKSDNELVQGRSELWSQRLAADGLSFAGRAKRLLRHDLAWESPLIEAPCLLGEQRLLAVLQRRALDDGRLRHRLRRRDLAGGTLSEAEPQRPVARLARRRGRTGRPVGGARPAGQPHTCSTTPGHRSGSATSTAGRGGCTSPGWPSARRGRCRRRDGRRRTHGRTARGPPGGWSVRRHTLWVSGSVGSAVQAAAFFAGADPGRTAFTTPR